MSHFLPNLYFLLPTLFFPYNLQFVEQPTLTSVAQTVVDKVVRLHHDNYLTKQRNVTFRDDISLIIRNFNFQLRGALTPGATSPRPPPRLLPRPKPKVQYCALFL